MPDNRVIISSLCAFLCGTGAAQMGDSWAILFPLCTFIFTTLAWSMIE